MGKKSYQSLITTAKSDLQKEILRLLVSVKAFERHNQDLEGLPRTRDILAGLGRDPSPANRASISRALKKLVDAGLIQRYEPETPLQGKGRMFSITNVNSKFD